MSSEVPPLPNGQATLPEMQTSTNEPTRTVVREEATEAVGPSVNASAAIGGHCIGESQLQPPSMASSATNGSVAEVTATPVSSATVVAPSAGTSAAPLPPMQDPEVIKAINVLRRYPDFAMMPPVGGGMNGAVIGPSAAPAVMPVPSSDGAVQQQPPQQQLQPPQQQQQQPMQQQQQPPMQQQQQELQQLLLQSPQQQQPQLPHGGGSPAMRSMQYTQLSSALPVSQQLSPYQQQRNHMPAYFRGQVVAPSHSPHPGVAGMMASGGPSMPSMHAAPFYYDDRQCYSVRDMMAVQSPPQPPPAAAAAGASYVHRQSSTMVTNTGGYHHSDQVAMYQDQLRSGVDNYCYVSRRRSTYPTPHPSVYDYTDQVGNMCTYPDPFMYPNPHGMYGNGMDGGHAAPGPYQHVPNGAGGYDNGGGGMMPTLGWNSAYAAAAAGAPAASVAPAAAAAAAAAAAVAPAAAAGSMNGNAGAAADTNEHQPVDAQSPILPSADPRPKAMPSAGSVSHARASGPVATSASGVQPMQHAAAEGEQVPGAAAAVSSGAPGAAVAANGCTVASTTSVASPVEGVKKSAEESGQAAAGSSAAADAATADSIGMCTDEVSTSADDEVPAPPHKRPQSTASEKPRKRLAATPSATEVTRCDSATQGAESSSTGGSNANGRSESRSAGKKASKHVPTSVAVEAVQAVCQPLETAALRPRKSCMGSIDGGQHRASTVSGAADTVDPAADPTAGPDDIKKKASPMWDVGAIVWARLSGERWWPAMTIEGQMALQKPAAGTYCWVFWYGDHKVSEIASEKIQWFASNFNQRFSSTGGKVYKKAVSEALQECIRRSGCAEADQVRIVEENDHLRACARQLFEQKGVSNIDKTPGTVTPLVADFLRAIVSRIPAADSPAASDGGASSGSKRVSAAADDDDDASTPSKAKAAVSGKLSAAASSPSLSSTGSKTKSANATKASSPGSKSPATSKSPSSSAAKPTQGSAKKRVRDAPHGSSSVAPASPAASTSSSCSNGGISSSNGVVSSSTGCSGSDEVKAGQGVSREQYRALHGKQLDDFFNEVRKDKRMLNELCIACHVHRKPNMVKHPLIDGGLCYTCKHKVMEALFSYGPDGCNVCCLLCGEGDELLVCGLDGCGKTYCKGCIETLGSPTLLERCLEANPWSCFTCSEEPIESTDRVSLIVRRRDWQAHVSQLFEKANSILHKGPSANDFRMKKSLRVLSLFDGISTGKLVLDQLGFDIEMYYASEIDPDSILVTTKNHADRVTQLGDVRDLTEEKLASLGRIDLIIGGSPCNDLALVNPTRKGIYDGTGVLFFDFYRILTTVKGLQPKSHVFWLFENVVCMREETKNTICRFLECEPRNFNAGHFSAQKRARYFWGNIPGLYTPLNPDILAQNITLQSVLTPGFNRKANVQKLRTVTTRTASLKQGHREEMFPVTMNGLEGRLWPTELERVFGMPDHYTDVGAMGPTKRQKLLGRAWCVPVVKHLLTPLKQFFLLKHGKETETDAARQ